MAKKEIKAFHQRRLSEFRQALLYYVEVNNEQLPNLTKFLNSANQKLLYIAHTLIYYNTKEDENGPWLAHCEVESGQQLQKCLFVAGPSEVLQRQPGSADQLSQ